MNAARIIAVGFDGSAEAESALRWTFSNARGPVDEVVVVHAAGLLEHPRYFESRHEVPPLVLALARECGFDEARVRWFVDDGDACSVLLRVSAPPVNADLLVVGSRGADNRGGHLLGSTSLEVVQHAPLPVVVVPRDCART